VFTIDHIIPAKPSFEWMRGSENKRKTAKLLKMNYGYCSTCYLCYDPPTPNPAVHNGL